MENDKLKTESNNANVLLGAVKCAEGWHDGSVVATAKIKLNFLNTLGIK